MEDRPHHGVCGLSVLGVVLAASVSGGCVREVLQGEDPETRTGRVTGDNRRDALVVRIPWMGMPEPRMLAQGKLVRTETVYTRSNAGETRFTLRTPGGTNASVDATSKELPDGSMEFSYRIVSLPATLVLDVAVPVKGNGLRPDIDLAVNGAPVKMEPGTEVVAVQLSRDAPTKLTALPRRPAETAPPQPKTPKP
jgi:hypothetical protein